MASGRHHDQATLLGALPLGLVITVLLGRQAGLIASFAFIAGGLWLSPDLDTQCKALQRWGIFGFLWWPYRRFIPHRSIWSHGPIIGTALRMMVLTSWLTLGILLIPGVSAGEVWESVQTWIQQQPLTILAFLLGLEANVWLHLIMDGDPMPSEWSRRRTRR